MIAAVADHLAKSPMDTSQRSGADIAASIDVRNELARRLLTMPTSKQRAELMALELRVELLAASVRISLGAEQAQIELPAKLVKRGSDVRLVIEEQRTATPDPVLRRLVAQAFAARDYLFTGTLHPCIREYSRRYLAQLARIAWLAPDIICAILDGTQPPQLTGRRLTRANAIPLDWPSQRVLFGFA